ncbi:hypothetical protein EK904_004902 [Melospiza melodia maxima]|nr:hypothetical protein EK904_004902 [Melospiza melodia maxima]
MARSTLSSRFRRLDIDQYDENRFVEEPEEAAAAEPDASPEVEALLRQYPLGRGGRECRAAAAIALGPGPEPRCASRTSRFESLTAAAQARRCGPSTRPSAAPRATPGARR